MMPALKYFVNEAMASLSRGYKTALIASATISTAFLVLGGFLLFTVNTERTFSRWREAAEFSVYLTDTATPVHRAAIEQAARDSVLVAAVETVSKDEALRRFKQNFSAMADAAGELPSNPLPASIEIRLRADANAGDVEMLAAKLTRLAGVADVRYDRRWIQRLMQAVGIVRGVGFTLAAVLVFAAALTVASVVRLALFVRREEIHIMQLVGAPIAYIKGPFVVEGFIQGGAGAVTAVVVLWMTFLTVRSRAASWLGGVVEADALSFLSVPMIVAMLAAGMAVGSIGGLIAAQSAREIHE